MHYAQEVLTSFSTRRASGKLRETCSKYTNIRLAPGPRGDCSAYSPFAINLSHLRTLHVYTVLLFCVWVLTFKNTPCSRFHKVYLVFVRNYTNVPTQ